MRFSFFYQKIATKERVQKVLSWVVIVLSLLWIWYMTRGVYYAKIQPALYGLFGLLWSTSDDTQKQEDVAENTEPKIESPKTLEILEKPEIEVYNGLQTITTICNFINNTLTSFEAEVEVEEEEIKGTEEISSNPNPKITESVKEKTKEELNLETEEAKEVKVEIKEKLKLEELKEEELKEEELKGAEQTKELNLETEEVKGTEEISSNPNSKITDSVEQKTKEVNVEEVKEEIEVKVEIEEKTEELNLVEEKVKEELKVEVEAKKIKLQVEEKVEVKGAEEESIPPKKESVAHTFALTLGREAMTNVGTFAFQQMIYTVLQEAGIYG